ncbi:MULTISPECIES: flagellar biosynthesis protein FliQ [Vibrio]|uniref:Flagellar biosynthetic protein FliQ n=1 Tax=Vibrio casei TaxID=673372 RepID=A0A368LJB8_9VIBR|nr:MULTISPECIES: flagellar biosynthesis protein FliQ [Vibrio]RCS70726.1 flagellar biosynthetic protein FliQ [Vibrio casei]SJN26622.1 Flagellar biosynthesis protein FliQ [Vibrio casei]HBV77560.1 flagellar biosynthetic protein FliQ [Vibrio sp.]
MPPEAAITIVGQAIYLVLIIVTALIAPSLLLGLLVAIFQAVTQINEQTLSFLPKLLATLLTIIIFGHWVIMELTTFFNLVFNSIPTVTQ